METPEDYFAALSNILRASNWRSTIERFLSDHAPLFDLPPDGEFIMHQKRCVSHHLLQIPYFGYR